MLTIKPENTTYRFTKCLIESKTDKNKKTLYDFKTEFLTSRKEG